MSRSSTRTELLELVDFLAGIKAVEDKVDIKAAYTPAVEAAQGLATLGDDCAAIPDGNGGYLLLAAEGLLDNFVIEDPWFAGYSAVMVNVSDVCAMGGRATAVVDVLCSPGRQQLAPVWDGMTAAAKAYRVPIVGGHTTLTRKPGPVQVGAAILGRAKVLLTSFDAAPGDELLMAVDLSGSYRGDWPFWNSSVGAPPDRLQCLAGLLPELAERGLCRAAKDISNGGIVGTLIMLLECSEVGASLDLEALPRPPGVDLQKWLISFPSFGYLLSVPPETRDRTLEHFANEQIGVGVIGEITVAQHLELRLGGESEVFWRASSQEN